MKPRQRERDRTFNEDKIEKSESDRDAETKSHHLGAGLLLRSGLASLG